MDDSHLVWRFSLRSIFYLILTVAVFCVIFIPFAQDLTPVQQKRLLLLSLIASLGVSSAALVAALRRSYVKAVGGKPLLILSLDTTNTARCFPLGVAIFDAIVCVALVYADSKFLSAIAFPNPFISFVNALLVLIYAYGFGSNLVSWLLKMSRFFELRERGLVIHGVYFRPWHKVAWNGHELRTKLRLFGIRVAVPDSLLTQADELLSSRANNEAVLKL